MHAMKKSRIWKHTSTMGRYTTSHSRLFTQGMVWYGEQYAEELGISVEYTGKYKNYNSYIIQKNVSILDTLVSEILSVIEIYIS